MNTDQSVVGAALIARSRVEKVKRRAVKDFIFAFGRGGGKCGNE